MERADPGSLRVGAHEIDHPVLHLLGGLVGERHGKYATRAHSQLTYQVRDPVRQNARLTASRAREYEQRPLAVSDRFLLNGIEIPYEVDSQSFLLMLEGV
jgi:hypothetical protein